MSTLSRENFEAIASIGFLTPVEIRRLDRMASAFLSDSPPSDPKFEAWITNIGHLEETHAKRYLRFLASIPLISLKILAAKLFFEKYRNADFLEFAANGLSYIGDYGRTRDLIVESGMHLKNKNVLAHLINLDLDLYQFDNAFLKIADTKLGDTVKNHLGDRISTRRRQRDAIVQHAGSEKYRVNVVNLPQDKYRRLSLTKRSAHLGIQCHFVKATRIDDIPSAYQRLLRLDAETISDGSFGNQISQYRIWETIAGGSGEYGVVIEDDGFIVHGEIECLDYDNLMRDVDILFVNDRLSTYASVLRPEGVQVCSLEETVIEACSVVPQINAFGSDGYVLSKKAARTLLDIVEREGFHSVGTDWYLLSHAFDRDRIADVPAGSISGSVLNDRFQRMENHATGGLLRGGVLSIALVEHRPLGTWRDSRIMT